VTALPSTMPGLAEPITMRPYSARNTTTNLLPYSPRPPLTPRPRTSSGMDRSQRLAELEVKQSLHDQNVKLRMSFLREDPRITGTCPRYLIQPVLRAGGLELTPKQAREVGRSFVNGDGRFNWQQFCPSVEQARSTAWSPRLRLQAMRTFAEIDTDGSGQLSRDELKVALGKLQVELNTTEEHLDKLIDRCDVDRSGTISYAEYIEALAKDRVTDGGVLTQLAKATLRNRPYRQ